MTKWKISEVRHETARKTNPFGDVVRIGIVVYDIEAKAAAKLAYLNLASPFEADSFVKGLRDLADFFEKELVCK